MAVHPAILAIRADSSVARTAQPIIVHGYFTAEVAPFPDGMKHVFDVFGFHGLIPPFKKHPTDEVECFLFRWLEN